MSATGEIIRRDPSPHVPTGVYGGRFNDDRTFFEDINEFIDVSYQPDLGGRFEARVRGFADSYRFCGRYTYYPDPDGVLGPPYPSERNEVEDQQWGGEALLTATWSPRHRSTYGVELREYKKVRFKYYSEDDPDHLLDERYDLEPCKPG